jgi:hypothetical protein
MFPNPQQRRPGGIPPPASQMQPGPVQQGVAQQEPPNARSGAHLGLYQPTGGPMAPGSVGGESVPPVAVNVNPPPPMAGRYQSSMQGGMTQGGPPQVRPQMGMAANPTPGGMGAGQVPMQRGNMPAPWAPPSQPQEQPQPGVGMNRPAPQATGMPQAARMNTMGPQPMNRPQTQRKTESRGDNLQNSY